MATFALVVCAAAAGSACQNPSAQETVGPIGQPVLPQPPPLQPVAHSVLNDHLLVTWYGNPHTSRMGVLGRYKGKELAAKLREQARAYSLLTPKTIVPAYHLVAVIAQPTGYVDGKWRRRESHETINALLEQARANGFKLILDIQPGHSTVRAELEYLRPHLEQPDVYLALDPEFAMPPGETPGRKIGRMSARDVNDALDVLEAIIRERNLPPKVLIVHQFTMKMLADKENIRDSAIVDVVLDMDGFGDRPLKRAIYAMVNRQRPLEFPAIKLFYKEDTNLFEAKQVMALRPEPAVVIYQ
jgi:hypothetical protein